MTNHECLCSTHALGCYGGAATGGGGCGGGGEWVGGWADIQAELTSISHPHIIQAVRFSNTTP